MLKSPADILLLTLISAAAMAQPGDDAKDRIVFESNAFSLDRQSNTMRYTGFRIEAGSWRLSADEALATATELDFGQGSWSFNGNLEVEIESASIRAEAAIFEFSDQLLVIAELTGDPIRFEDTASIENETIEGTAERIIYNNTAQSFELLGAVSLTVGPYTTTGCDLVYFPEEEQFETGSVNCPEGFRTTFIPESQDNDEQPAIPEPVAP